MNPSVMGSEVPNSSIGLGAPVVDVASLLDSLPSIPATGLLQEAARVRLADTAFATIVGSSSPQGAGYYAIAERLYGAPAASLAGTVFRYVASTRMTEIDDIDLPSCMTAGAMVVPLVLGLIAREPRLVASPDDVVALVAVGYQAALAVGEALDGPMVLARGTWPTLAAAAVVTAIVYATALRLDDRERQLAVELAAYVGEAANPRGSAREVLLAGSVVLGLQAVAAVLAGFAAEPNPSDRHFDRLLVAGAATGVGPARLDPLVALKRPGIKGFCSARQAMAAVVGVQTILGDRPLALSAIGKVRVGVPTAYRAMVDKPSVRTRRESLASMQYQVAAALVAPAHLLDVARRSLKRDRAFREVMAHVEVAHAPELDELYPARWPAQVELELGGEQLNVLVSDITEESDCSATRLTRKVTALAPANGVDDTTAELITGLGDGVVDLLEGCHGLVATLDARPEVGGGR